MKYLTILLLTVWTSLGVLAQNRSSFPDDIDKQKVDYVMQHMELTDLQKKSLYSLYSQWQHKEHMLRKGRMQRFLRFRTQEEIEKMSSEEVNKAIDDELRFKLQLMQLERYFLSKIRAVIPPKKVVDLFRLQESFKRDLLRKYKNSKLPEPKAKG